MKAFLMSQQLHPTGRPSGAAAPRKFLAARRDWPRKDFKNARFRKSALIRYISHSLSPFDLSLRKDFRHRLQLQPGLLPLQLPLRRPDLEGHPARSAALAALLLLRHLLRLLERLQSQRDLLLLTGDLHLGLFAHRFL